MDLIWLNQKEDLYCAKKFKERINLTCKGDEFQADFQKLKHDSEEENELFASRHPP